MPEICRFYGLVIRMYLREHGSPHFHVQYAERRAVFAIEPLELLRGELPPRARRLVVEWGQQHQKELLDDWELASEHEPLRKIAPLE